jgi:hypothetical protein
VRRLRLRSGEAEAEAPAEQAHLEEEGSEAMTTGYEAAFYRHIERLARAQERLADVETARYLRQVIETSREESGTVPDGATLKLREMDRRIYP